MLTKNSINIKNSEFFVIGCEYLWWFIRLADFIIKKIPAPGLEFPSSLKNLQEPPGISWLIFILKQQAKSISDFNLQPSALAIELRRVRWKIMGFYIKFLSLCTNSYSVRIRDIFFTLVFEFNLCSRKFEIA